MSLILCFAIIVSSSSTSAFAFIGSKKTNAITVDTVHGIIAGESLQIHAFSDGVLLENIELTSSNPSVVSCLPGGYIRGEKCGDYADITCTTQDGLRKTFTVYCVRAVYPQEECSTNSLRTPIYAQPKNGMVLSIYVSLSEFGRIVEYVFYILAFVLSIIKIDPFSNSPESLSVFTAGNFKVCGQYGNYAYIRFDDNPSSDGFISYSKLNKKLEEFLYISDSELTVKVGEQSVFLTANYPGEIIWTLENDEADGNIDYENSIIKFDPTVGVVIPKKGGVTSIRATANGMGRTCEIISIYMWPQEWKVVASQEITLYSKPDAVNGKGKIKEGDTFWVVGDLGGSNSWCYVNHGSQAFPEYSYAKIEDFSTKGTISQYNELDWSWPIKATKNGVEQAKKPNYISSPYGWRDAKPKNHQGIDITTGNAGEIAGYDIVSAFDGTVIFRGDKYGYDWGYCVAIRSDCVDPISGKNFVAVYMHLMHKPDVIEGEKVIAGETVLGQVGNTTTPGIEMGYHLHFEFNNQTSSIGVTSDGSQTTGYGRKSFDYLVNPIFLYMDEYHAGELTYYKNSESEKNYFKTFWYGNGKELEDVY